MPHLRILPALIALFVACPPLLAHEVWLDASTYQPTPGETLSVQIINGQEFQGINLAYFGGRTVRFDRIEAGETRPVDGRDGDIPAMSTDDLRDGLLVLAYQSTPSTLTYREWDKFAEFIRHKDFRGAEARHDARGLPRENFQESYTRFAKALIGVGGAAGSDRRTGLETEFVALANPYTDDLADGMPFQLFYGDVPRADAQVELFERAPGGAVSITYHRTDSDGLVRLPVRSGHVYLVDAVVLREPAPEILRRGPVWESLWAATTFAVP